ncbi:MAG: SUMF1/EgtB/PvdO family nonheme iron enzyme, partial [Anaerolineales bacterium]|nr:SUMF1/EgtB/PvdO family nonheme iron enzyme [Anaerolineales bacterium]
MLSRVLLFIFIVIFLGMALPGCRGTESDLQTPTTIYNQQDKQATPTSQETPKESRIRPVDEMMMVYVPSGTFQMGSTEAEINDAIALCQQHYSICNRWYYERESPQHPVSLDGFWIDQAEVSNAQYRQCVEDGICPEPST